MVKKQEEKEGRLDKEKQKGLKTITKLLKIFAQIARVLVYLGIACIILVMIAIPPVMKDVKVDRHEITYKNEKIELLDEEEGISVNYNGRKLASMNLTEREALYKILDSFSNKRLTRIMETALGVSIVLMVISLFSLSYFIKLMKNINEENTPFNTENPVLIRKIAIVTLITVGVTIFGNLLVSAVGSININVNIDYAQIGFALGLFGLASIFEYGNSLQKESSAKIYDEN